MATRRSHAAAESAGRKHLPAGTPLMHAGRGGDDVDAGVNNDGDDSSCSKLPRRALLIVDMTVEQLPPGLPRRADIIETVRQLARSGVFVACFDCRLWIEDPAATSLTWVYGDVGLAGTDGARLHKQLEDLGLEFIPKSNYSAFYGSQLERRLVEEGVTDVYICGVNTDYCVFATALDAFYRMYGTYVVEDGCSSVAGVAGHKEGLRRITQHFSSSAIVGSNELLP